MATVGQGKPPLFREGVFCCLLVYCLFTTISKTTILRTVLNIVDSIVAGESTPSYTYIHMSKFFTKTFFHFLFGFIGILTISLGFIVFVQYYNNKPVAETNIPASTGLEK